MTSRSHATGNAEALNSEQEQSSVGREMILHPGSVNGILTPRKQLIFVELQNGRPLKLCFS
jgi:hypothetical protein